MRSEIEMLQIGMWKLFITVSKTMSTQGRTLLQYKTKPVASSFNFRLTFLATVQLNSLPEYFVCDNMLTITQNMRIPKLIFTKNIINSLCLPCQKQINLVSLASHLVSTRFP